VGISHARVTNGILRAKSGCGYLRRWQSDFDPECICNCHTAREKSAQAEQVKARLGELKKATPRDETAIEETDSAHSALTKEAREATANAEAIESAVYDLKAVNPNRKANVDTRRPARLLDLIEEKGREIAAALAALRNRTQT
jgi:hypothetical protein